MDAGVDVLVDESPRDWLRPAPKVAIETQAAVPATEKAPPEPAPECLPDELRLFEAYLKTSEALPFAAPSAPRVGPAGDAGSELMILVDMPGTEDCASGTLLSGEAGALFDRMMAAIGRDRPGLYIASLSSIRSPDGRFTRPAAARCAELARHHIGLAQPKAVLLFGDACSRALLSLSMAEARGRWHRIATETGTVNAIVTIAPDFLLKQPSAKAHAWVDLQMLAEGLNR
jgi:DNA polymerase